MLVIFIIVWAIQEMFYKKEINKMKKLLYILFAFTLLACGSNVERVEDDNKPLSISNATTPPSVDNTTTQPATQEIPAQTEDVQLGGTLESNVTVSSASL